MTAYPRWLAVVMVAVGICAMAPLVVAAPIRVAYFYHYMPASHLDSLAAHGFNRAVIHSTTDSLDVRGVRELQLFLAVQDRLRIEVVPQWAIQAMARLATRPALRRYTWGNGVVEREIACPLDSLYWRSALLDRAEEHLAVAPGLKRLAVDLEFHRGGRHHYDAGPCRCAPCIAEYLVKRPELAGRDPRRLTGLFPYQEARVRRIVQGLLVEFAEHHPGVEIGVFDLDYDSFVHRAVARALARARVPTADYCERSYSVAGGPLTAVRAKLQMLGHPNPTVIGGLWLKRFAPSNIVPAVRSITERSQGWFVFTTFSLWLDPSKLSGPYTLLGSQAKYWRALGEANRVP